ncbi:MAG: hypothetical protein H0W50_07115 [Parachlamydiaceae bacterium]|nr:hypothetical protein [Parachlamydiaceae bacterium]
MNCMQQYADLIRAFQLYISQQGLKGKWMSTDRQNYEYFLQLASAKTLPKPQSTLPVQQKNTTTTARTPIVPTSVPLHSLTPPVQAPLPQEIAQQAPVTKLIKTSTPAKASAEESIKKPELAIEVKSSPKDVLHQKQIALEIAPPSTPTDFTEMRTFFKEKLPNVVLTETIADDNEAKALALRWKAPPAEIVILSFSDHAPEKAFLTNLSFTLNQCFGSAKLISAAKIEEEKGWDQLLKTKNLRLVIASHNSLHALPELMKFYHEEATGKHKLGRTQLFLLSDLSLYMQQPSLKASLWRALVQQVSSLDKGRALDNHDKI